MYQHSSSNKMFYHSLFFTLLILIGKNNISAFSSPPSLSVKPKVVKTTNPLWLLHEKQPTSRRKQFFLLRAATASELLKSLVEKEKCYTTEKGARAFCEACDPNVVYDDCYEPKPIVGQTALQSHLLGKVQQRNGRGDFRLDKISDGNKACGFAWTWTCNDEEGLRGTTFVELNNDEINPKIKYVREIPESIAKPGDVLLELLKAATKGLDETVAKKYEKRKTFEGGASDLVKYLFLDVQGNDIDETVSHYDDNVVWRDFNYENAMNSKNEAKQFIEDWTIPGVVFKVEKFDDGFNSCCFAWKCYIDILSSDEDNKPPPTPVKGISLYEINPATKKIVYIRDIAESNTKPPPLGKLARLLRPGIGVLSGSPIGSRTGGM